MRRRLLRATLPALAALALGGPVGAAPAAARSSYCSPTGDYCKAAYKQGGKRRIELRTAALYGPTTSYELCVRDPAGEETCRTFRLRHQRSGLYRSRVTWSAHFPTDGPRGTYLITYDHGGIAYGPSLSFRR
jgi:hypothetical protein